MNSQLAIIVAIDVESALKKKNLKGNIYLVDNARAAGSTGEGTGELVTAIVGTQIMNWLVTGTNLDPTSGLPIPTLVNIKGDAVDEQIMVPELFDSPVLGDNQGLWWGATVSADEEGTYDYTLCFDIGGTELEYVSSFHAKPTPARRAETAEAAAVPQRPQVMPRPLQKRAIPSLQARATADGSIRNPDQHVSLFSRQAVSMMKTLAKNRSRS